VLLRSFHLNGHDQTLTEDALFELALAVAGSHADVDTVESKLRAAVISL